MMTNHDALMLVRQFFAAEGYARLILPSGWFGRPYDSLHELTRTEASGSTLVIELDGRLILTFSGEVQAALDEEGLRLSNFTTLAFDRTEYDSSRSHHDEFDTGEVVLVSPTAGMSDA